MFAHPRLSAPLLALGALLSGCFQGSGRVETRSFPIDGFDSVDASRYVDVEVVRGDALAVEVTADDNLWGDLVVRRDGQTLVLGVSDARPLYSGITVHAVVTMPTLSSVHLSGGAHASLAGFDAPLPALAVHASGGSHLEGAVQASDLSIELSGGSGAALEGAADALTVDASGGSRFDLSGPGSRAAAVWLSGGSRGTLTVSDQLDYHLSGSSHLEYAGDPDLGQQETSGESSVVRR